MKRVFPSIAMFALIFFVTFGVSVSHGAVIYSTFGTGDSYSSGGLLVSSSQSLAMPFTPLGSFTLNTIELAALYRNGTNSMNVVLLGDSSGLPNSANILETWNFTNVASGSSILTGISLVNPLLASGTQYWLAVFPGDPSFQGGWNYSFPGIIGPFDVSFNGGTTWNPISGTLGAFRISGTPPAPVPEPSTMLLLGSGLAGLLGYGKRRFKK